MAPEARPAAERAGVPLASKALAAGSAALVSAVLMNPFQLVATRMQAAGAGAYRGLAPCWCEGAAGAAAAAAAAAAAGAAPAAHRAVSAAAAAAAVPPAPPCSPASCSRISSRDGAFGALSKIVRHEGVAQLWRGTSASLAMAVPLVGVYMPCYEALREALAARGGAFEWAAPLVAGACSRTLAVSVVAPIDFARTRMQAEAAAVAAVGGIRRASGGADGVARVFADFLRGPDGRLSLEPRRLRALWTGVGPALLRDVPFSALYWAGVEPLRETLLARRRQQAGATGVAPGDAALANLMAGTAAGAGAALVTTPLDVAKTRLQVRIASDAAALRSVGELGATMAELRALAREGGMAALFTGVVPRVARLAPSCGIVLVSYELVKRFIGVAA